MEVERGHRGGSELFVCFTSRQSSSSTSMKISSKSILSPGRTDKFRETSVCRRLKSNGSIKGQSSPMFPTGRKKSSSFETQEPSSPKVTCIGQVRVKTKQGKRRKAMASRSGEVSFRGNGSKREQHECLPNRNQRWGHLFGFRKEISLSICEAIRDFNCFLPCGGGGGGGGGSGGGSSGKDSGTTGKERKETSSACGAVFARWLMVLQESDEKRLQEEEMEEGQCLVDQTAIVEEQIEKKGEDAEGEIEEETIAVPPRNALLLMRCRSEPFRVSSLANRFWDSPAPKEEHEDDDEVEEDEDDDDDDAEVEDAYEEEAADAEQGEDHKEHKLITYQGVSVLELVEEHPILQEEEEEEEKHEEEAKEDEEEKEEVGLEQVSSEELLEKETVSETHFSEIVEDEKEEKTEHSDGYSGTRETLALEDSTESSGWFMQTPEEESTENGGHVQTREEDDSARNGRDVQTGEEEDSVENGGYVQTGEVEDSTTNGGYVQTQEAMALEDEDEEEEDSTENAGYEQTPEAVVLEEQEAESEREEEEGEGEDSTEKNELEERTTTETSEAGPVLADGEEKPTQQEKENRLEKQEEEEEELEEEQGQQEQQEQKEEERCPKALPDCLLLMMCEPKLSMEVSKETWVCSTDFLRRRPVKAEEAKGSEESKQRVSTEEKAALAVAEAPVAAPTPPPPPPPPVSMAKIIEQKLVNAYEPFVLTRCKSEPLRSSDKLAPEACFWKSRKLERPTVGVGAAGMGF